MLQYADTDQYFVTSLNLGLRDLKQKIYDAREMLLNDCVTLLPKIDGLIETIQKSKP